MKKKLHALYGLKYNPFSQEIPTEGLFVSTPIDSFCWRIEQQLAEGGFALVVGDPGTGKSSVLRILTSRLNDLRDVMVGILTRPQASLADFYRELGDLFGVPLNPHNRWAGAKALRTKWQASIESSPFRPVLIIDEGQDTLPSVFNELRLLSSADLDSRSILTVVLAGDHRLTDKLSTPELLPVGSRIRTRLRTEYATAESLRESLKHVLHKAGNPSLMTEPLLGTLCEHAAGNYRVLINLANDMLAAAVQKEIDQLDENLYFDVFDMAPKPSKKRKRS